MWRHEGSGIKIRAVLFYIFITDKLSRWHLHFWRQKGKQISSVEKKFVKIMQIGPNILNMSAVKVCDSVARFFGAAVFTINNIPRGREN